MTREEAREAIKEAYGNSEYTDEIIKALEQQPSEDCVSMGVYKQIAWERDIAIEQLRELGYEFGEKIRTSDDCVSRQAMLDAITKIDGGTNMDIYTNEVREIVKALPPVTPTLPQEATNGDMIRLIFGEEFEKKAWVFCSQSWWNAPYKEVKE